MKIQLIVIGDEILSGQIADLNTKWLSAFLYERGLKLSRSLTLGDDEDIISVEFKRAIEDYDYTFVTGGLGPTKDDKTKLALAKAFNLKLVQNEQSVKKAKANYLRFGREWSEESDRLHDNPYQVLPNEIVALNNPRGLAPGLMYEKGNTIFCAPGVPIEFHSMVSEEIFPLIEQKKDLPISKLERFRIRTFGIPEEKIFYELCPGLWKELEEFGQVSSLPRVFGVDIVIYLNDNREETKNKIKSIIESGPLKKHVWQYGELELPELFLKLANEKNIRFSFAESCTGGLLSSLITDIPGSSKTFMGSSVTYINQAKMDLLGVKSETLELVGAVSEETAEQMAIGSLKAYHSQIAVSTSGIAGPGGGTTQKPVGTLSFGWAYNINGKIHSGSEIVKLRGDRLKLKMRFAYKALDKALEILQSKF